MPSICQNWMNTYHQPRSRSLLNVTGNAGAFKGRRSNGEPRLSFEAEKTTFDISLYVYRLYSEYRKRFKDTRNGFKLLVIISLLKLRILQRWTEKNLGNIRALNFRRQYGREGPAELTDYIARCCWYILWKQFLCEVQMLSLLKLACLNIMKLRLFFRDMD